MEVHCCDHCSSRGQFVFRAPSAISPSTGFCDWRNEYQVGRADSYADFLRVLQDGWQVKFSTETGSLYEVDEEHKKIRRLSGKIDPQPRQGKDGEWKEYDILFLTVDRSASIIWPEGTPLLEGSPTCAIPATITSRVLQIVYDESDKE